MSCIFCIHYNTIGVPCKKEINVKTGSESFNCPHYTYNKKLKVKK